MKAKLVLTDFPRLERKVEELTSIPARLTPGEQRKIGDRIRLGFQHSFTSEGEGAGGSGTAGAEHRRQPAADRRSVGSRRRSPNPQAVRKLRSSWVDRSDRNHWEQWGSFAGMTVVTVGSVHRLAPYHSGGTANMPARRVEVLTEQDLDGIGDTIGFVFSERLNRGG